MAKDTEKLIRQLSLISYLMAERRPVTALEIRRDVEGYSNMNEDAFARRFYADRAELSALSITLNVDRPTDGGNEQENYSLPPENFHLPDIDFTDSELAALQTALQLLDGKFAYAEPLRLALQQLTWGRPDPLKAPEQRSVALGITGSAGGQELSQRLAKIETAIFRRKTVIFDYYTIGRDETSARKVDPYQLLFQSGQFYLIGYSHERSANRMFKLSRMQGKVAYSTKAEHDFERPSDFDPRVYAQRVAWQMGDDPEKAEIWISERIIWQVRRYFSHCGEFTKQEGSEDWIFTTEYVDDRQLLSWVLGLGEQAKVLGPDKLVDELGRRAALIVQRHSSSEELDLEPVKVEAPESKGERKRTPQSAKDVTIRPERFARLVTLASILIRAGRAGKRCNAEELCSSLKLTAAELKDDVEVLNVVNFGGGSYVLYAEMLENGEIEVDPEPYSDNFARPARLLPVEAKALIAATDLIGEHLPEGSLLSARQKIVDAIGRDPTNEGLQVSPAPGDDKEITTAISEAISKRKQLKLEYYKDTEDVFTERIVEPHALVNGKEGWYVATYDPSRKDTRHFRIDRIKQVEVTEKEFKRREDFHPLGESDSWPSTGEIKTAKRAKVWISPERARWVREERTVLSELKDGAAIVELAYGSDEWLIQEILKEAGDAALIEPQETRAKILATAEKLSPQRI